MVMTTKEYHQEEEENTWREENSPFAYWREENVCSLREDFLMNDPSFKEQHPFGQENDFDRRDYIENQGLEDEFEQYVKEQYNEVKE